MALNIEQQQQLQLLLQERIALHGACEQRGCRRSAVMKYAVSLANNSWV